MTRTTDFQAGPVPISPPPGNPELCPHPFQKCEPPPFQFPLTPLLCFPPPPLRDNVACMQSIWGSGNPTGYASLMKYLQFIKHRLP